MRKRYIFTETGEVRQPGLGEWAIDKHGMIYCAGPKSERRRFMVTQSENRIMTVKIEDVEEEKVTDDEYQQRISEIKAERDNAIKKLEEYMAELRRRAWTPQPAPLKPCPFCGHSGEEGFCVTHWGSLSRIKCYKCSNEGPLAHGVDEARAAWNKRVTP